MLLKDNEEKRNIAWRTVMTVTSVLIILIVVFFAVKLFTSNPLTGNWENTDDGMKLTIKNNGTMNIVQTLDESTVSVPVDYTIDMEHKRFAIHVNEEKIAIKIIKTDVTVITVLQAIFLFSSLSFSNIKITSFAYLSYPKIPPIIP